MTRPTGELRDVTVGRFGDALAAAGPGPAAGSTAAVTTALAAGLAAKVARAAAETDPAGLDLAAELDRLRARALGLADDDVVAYAGFLRARRAPGGAVAAAEAIIQVPMDVLAAAVRVNEVAAALAEEGPDALAGDAVTAALLTAAAAESAATLVGANLADVGAGIEGAGDPRLDDAEERAGRARARAERLM